MSQSASQYPISKVIDRIMNDSGLRRSQFVQSLGYRSVQGGLRRLDEWLQEGHGDSGILDRISAAYHVDRGELETALAATAEMKASETQAAQLERLKNEHGRFRSYIHVEGEYSVPSGICAFGMTGGHRRWTCIPLPQELQGRPLSDQMPGLIGLMKEYLEKYNRVCPFFGRVTGFRLVRWSDSVRFSLGGEFVEHVEGPFKGPRTEVRMGNKLVLGARTSYNRRQ